MEGDAAIIHFLASALAFEDRARCPGHRRPDFAVSAGFVATNTHALLLSTAERQAR